MRWIVVAFVSMFVCASAAWSQPAKGMVPIASTEPLSYQGETLKQWIDKLNSPDAAVRDAALRVLPLFGPPAEVALPKMLAMMVGDGDTSVRVTAIRVITMNPTVENEKYHTLLIQNLNTLLAGQVSILRLQAALAVSRLGANGSGCIGKLCDISLKDSSSYEVRLAAANALGMIARGQPETGPDMRAVTALLHTMNTDVSLVVRGEAVQSLITLGPPRVAEDWDKSKAALISRLAREVEPAQKMWLRVCLMRMDSTLIKANMPLVIKELANPKLRVAAAEAIGMMGREGKVCLKELTAGVNSVEDPENFAYAAMCMWALAQMEAEAFPALGDIQKLLTHKNETLRAYAKYAQERITTGAKLPPPKP